MSLSIYESLVVIPKLPSALLGLMRMTANVTMQSARGEIHSDFDVKIDSTIIAQTPPLLPQSRTRNLRIRQSNQRNRTVIGKINGGSSEIQLKTYKGNIYIRKFSDASNEPQGK
jgi:hypothetical protein